jgi:hypothetical protein
MRTLLFLLLGSLAVADEIIVRDADSLRAALRDLKKGSTSKLPLATILEVIQSVASKSSPSKPSMQKIRRILKAELTHGTSPVATT